MLRGKMGGWGVSLCDIYDPQNIPHAQREREGERCFEFALSFNTVIDVYVCVM